VFFYSFGSCLIVTFQKAKARLQVLRQSTTLDETAKKRIESVLQAKYMLSEESLVEDSSDNNDSDDRGHSSDSDREHSKAGKKSLLGINFHGGVENLSTL